MTNPSIVDFRDRIMEAFDMEEIPRVDDHGRCINCKGHVNVEVKRLSKGLIVVLKKFAIAVGRKRQNCIHLRYDITGDIELTKVEYNSFQKLRYHALVAKVREKPGSWLLTHIGSEFLHGRMSVPEIKYTYKNFVAGQSDERINIRDIKREPWWPQLEYEILGDEQYHRGGQASFL